MGIFKEIDHSSFEHLIAWWNGPLPAWADEDDDVFFDSRASFYSELACAIGNFGSRGIQFLKQFTRAIDQEQRQSALSALAWPDMLDEAIECDLLAAFSEESEQLKTVALWGFIHIKRYPLIYDDIAALLEIQNARIAALAMVYLSHAYPAEAIAILQNGLSDNNPYKRSYACDEVGDRDINDLTELVGQLRNDPVPEVREAAASNYHILTNR